jgi:hypothetical protein
MKQVLAWGTLKNYFTTERYVDVALKRSIRYKDKSSLYKGYKDLNDWLVHLGKLQKSETLKQSEEMRF